MNNAAENKPEYFGRDLEAMSFADNYHRWILAEFSDYLGHSVAEVGAGAGSFTRLLLDAGVNRVTAFEPSRNMYPLLEKVVGDDARVTPVNGFFEGACHQGGFDSIVYVNVLEHIENDREELAGAYQALKPGGHMLIFVPALPWLYSDLDKKLGHFRRYMKRDLVSLAEQTGFAVVKARYFDIAGIIPWYVNFVLLKNRMGSKSVALYDKLVIPVIRWVERFFKPPVGKNVLLVVTRPATRNP